MLFNEVLTRNRGVQPAAIPVIVYGTRWCAKTQMVRRHLDRLGVPYSFIDLDSDPAAKDQLRWLTGGYAMHPAVYIGGQMLIEPDMATLDHVLSYAAFN
jgi:mycoredoxin